MTVITIISDWKKNDFYSGAIKGAILSVCQDVTFVDISHEVQSFNIAQAAFIIRNSYKNFPKGSIHLICIKSESNSETPYLIAEADGHYFIGADNGMFGLIFSDNSINVYAIKNVDKNLLAFPELSVFSNAAIHLTQKKDIKDIANKIKEYNKQIPLRATIDESVINGSVIYIDSYQNVITNISKELFERIGKKRPFEIFILSNHYKITKINTQYQETTSGELLAIFNSINLLEIAINNGNIAELLNLEIGTNIRVKFK